MVLLWTLSATAISQGASTVTIDGDAVAGKATFSGLTVSSATVSGVITANAANVAGNVTAGSVTSAGTLSAPTINSSSNLTAANFTASGNVTIFGNLSGVGNLIAGANNPSMKVGIGTPFPDTKMTVVKPYTINGNPNNIDHLAFGVYKTDMTLLLSTDNLRAQDKGGSVGFSNANGFVLGAIKGAATNSVTSESGGYLGFYTTGYYSGGSPVRWTRERMRIAEDGNVGIATTSPLARLQVAAEINGVTGSGQIEAIGEAYANKTKRLIMGYDTAGNKGFIQSKNGSTLTDLNLNPNGGNVGVGVATAPKQALEVNGRLRLDSQITTGAVAAGGIELCAYARGDNPELLIMDAAGDYTRLNSHASPNDVDPAASSSFTDPGVALPFSFKHGNAYIGKGQIVDMAKVVAWAEKKMKAEMGDKAGRVVYTYDLPAGERLPPDQYAKAQCDQQVSLALERLEKMPWIETPLGADGRIPDEAFVEIPIYDYVKKKVRIAKKEIDYKTRRLVTVEYDEEMTTPVKTEKTETKLSPNWRLENGVLYRKPTVRDINVEALVKEAPQLPKWVLDRITAGRQATQDISELTGKIRQILSARATADASQQAALASD